MTVYVLTITNEDGHMTIEGVYADENKAYEIGKGMVEESHTAIDANVGAFTVKEQFRTKMTFHYRTIKQKGG